MPPSDSEADELPPLRSELATPISENRTVSDQQQTPRAGPVARSRAPLPSSSVLSDLPSTLSSGEESAEDEDDIVTSTVEHWRKLQRKHSTYVHPVRSELRPRLTTCASSIATMPSIVLNCGSRRHALNPGVTACSGDRSTCVCLQLAMSCQT